MESIKIVTMLLECMTQLLKSNKALSRPTSEEEKKEVVESNLEALSKATDLVLKTGIV